MSNVINIIYEDHELLDENYYYERFYDMNLKHNKIKNIFKLIGVDNINYVDLKTAKKSDKTHVYICFKPSVFKINHNENFFSDELLDSIRLNNHIKIVYLMAEETIDGDNFTYICNYFNKKNINHNQIILYTNGANLDLLTEKINFYPIIFKSSFLSLFYLEIFKKNTIEFISDRKFIFLSQNRRFKNHRFLILSYLHYNGLLDITDWSLIENPIYFNDEFNMDSLLNICQKDDLKMCENFGKNLKEIKNKKGFYENDMNINEIENCVVNLNSFSNSYINLTSETNFIEPSIHITEKSFKPFYYYQIPIIISNCGHIKKMRELYNFDFFDDFVNHDYDNEKDNCLRLKKIFSEIKKINENKIHIKNFFEKNRNRFEKNKEIYLNLDKNKECDFLYKL